MFSDQIEDWEDAIEAAETVKPASLRTLGSPGGPVGLLKRILEVELAPQGAAQDMFWLAYAE
ncbi:hypothetical protein Neosp_008102 [[Neocosmospora] mangrovei]